MNSEWGAVPSPEDLESANPLVHLWWIRLDCVDKNPAVWRQFLTESEWSDSQRFRFEMDRLRFVTCRAVLRRALSERIGRTPRDIALIQEEYGKPQLTATQNTGNWRFNVAHSGQLGCVALTTELALGVDVETTGKSLDVNLVIKKVLSAREVRAFERLPDAAKPYAFLRYWTRKEAVAKLTGMGLGLPLDEVEMDLTQHSHLVQLPASHQPEQVVHVQDISTGMDDYRAALAIAGRRAPRVIVSDWPDL